MNATPPDPSQHPHIPQLPRIPESHSLVQLFLETFLIMGRYFIVVYPVFLYFILTSFLVPRVVPDYSHWGWWVIGAGLAMALLIFKAGWNVMMYKAVQEWEELRRKLLANQLTPGEIQQIPFKLLKDFIPGMGEYGVTFLTGGLLWLVLALIPVVGLMAAGYLWIGIPNIVTTLMNQADITPTQIQHMLEAATVLERSQLMQWQFILLGIALSLMALNGLTLFWQPFAIIKQCNPLRAFVYSSRHALRHPFHTLLIMLYVGLSTFSFSFLGSFPNPITAFLGNFLLIIVLGFSGLFLYLYLNRVDAEPSS